MESQKIIYQGAEAIIKINEKEKIILKERTSKSYRLKEIDEKIRKKRTKSEIKLLEKASKIINSPKPIISKSIPLNKTNNSIEGKFLIKMPFIEGKKLSENLNFFKIEKQIEIAKEIGRNIGKLHNQNIIHGDLTTSNMILQNESFEKMDICFIDFGLGFVSEKIEDKAVDIHLLKQALDSTHHKNSDELFEKVKEGYSEENKESEKVFERIRAVEKRGRYKH